MEAIDRGDLFRVPAVEDGLDRLKHDIAAGARAFCICAVGRDYHVGAWDSRETLLRASKERRSRPQLLRVLNLRTEEEVKITELTALDDIEELVFVPLDPVVHLKLEEFVDECRRDIDLAHQILTSAYGGYQRSEPRLTDQEPEIRETLIEAFQALRSARLLPISTGSAAFNHQAMVLLMAQCFPLPEQLNSFLQTPSLLRHEGKSEFAKNNARRIELTAKRETGDLTAEEQVELKSVCQKLDDIMPAIPQRAMDFHDEINVRGELIDKIISDSRDLLRRSVKDRKERE